MFRYLYPWTGLTRSLSLCLKGKVSKSVYSDYEGYISFWGGRFNPGRSTTEIISSRQLQEKYWERRISSYEAFVDLTTASDSINRDDLWSILDKIGCSPDFLRMFKQLHWEMRVQFIFSGSLSESIAMNNEVKQNDILASTLFSISLLWVSRVLSRIANLVCTCVSGPRIKSLIWLI